jgi:hypothetical protein
MKKNAAHRKTAKTKARKVFIATPGFLFQVRLTKKAPIYYHKAMKFNKLKPGPLDIVILAGAVINLVVITLILFYYFSG